MAEGNAFKHELRLANGQVQTYEAATEQELLIKVQQAHQASVDALTDRENQIRQKDATLTTYQRQVQELQAAQKPTKQTSATVDANVQKGWDDFETQFAQQYGIKPSEIAAIKKKQDDLDAKMGTQGAVSQFYGLVDDYPATPEANLLLQQRIDALTAEGFPLNGKTMKMAWTDIKEEGLIEPSKKAVPTEREPSRGAAAIPSTTPSSTESAPLEGEAFDDMSTADMEAYLQKQGML